MVLKVVVAIAVIFFIFYSILKIILEFREWNKETKEYEKRMEEDHKRMETVFKEMEEDHKKGYKPLEGRAKDVFTGTYCAK